MLLAMVYYERSHAGLDHLVSALGDMAYHKAKKQHELRGALGFPAGLEAVALGWLPLMCTVFLSLQPVHCS